MPRASTKMKNIKIGKNKYAKVNNSDYPLVEKYSWHINSNGYAVTFLPRIKINGKIKRPIVYMHRLILNLQDKNLYCDHKNGNRADNTRTNLRPASPTQNSANIPKKKFDSASSGFKGVSWSVLNKNWRCRVSHKGAQVWMGSFKKEEDAAVAYNKVAKELFGEFASLNAIK